MTSNAEVFAYISKDCLVTRINVNNKEWSPSQNHGELERFYTNFELLPSNINDHHPTCSIVLGDFKAKYQNGVLLKK